MTGIDRLPDWLPGLALLVSIALGSHVLANWLPGVNTLVLAVAVGVVIGNVWYLPDWARSGVEKQNLLLEVGIVLLGAGLAIDRLARVGLSIIALAVMLVVFGVVLVEALSRLVFGVEGKIGSLLAAGSSICGVSAVVAVAGGIDADETDIAFATATVLLFDAITLVVFPVLGDVLGLTGRSFGLWAGLSMFSTGPVAAAGFAVSETAGRWATLTKLVRNSLIGLLVVGYSFVYMRTTVSDGPDSISIREVWTRFPKFVVGFVIVAALANTGLITAADQAALGTASNWIFAVAFAGLGFEIRLRQMRRTGITPILITLVYLITISFVSLLVIQSLGL